MSKNVSYRLTHHRPATIKGVRIGNLGADEIRRLSVVEVVETSTYDKIIPKTGSINDHRMGCTDRRIACKTCGRGALECPGHAGHIELPYPVYNVGDIDRVARILRNVCFFCCALLQSDAPTKQHKAVVPEGKRLHHPETDGTTTTDDTVTTTTTTASKPAPRRKKGANTNKTKGRKLHKDDLASASVPTTGSVSDIVEGEEEQVTTQAVATSSEGKRKPVKIKKCSACGSPQPSKYECVRKNMTLAIRPVWQDVVFDRTEDLDESRKPFTPYQAQQILFGISDADYEAMGYSPHDSHPSAMIITALTLPPPSVRPSVAEHVGAKARGLDDLTTSLKSIIRNCQRIRNFQKKYPDYEDMDPTLLADLQYDVATYMNNSNRGLKQNLQKSGCPKKSIADRLKGKEGRVRGLMGKRVDFTARCVISPDPNLDADEIGVPLNVAMVATLEERVTDFNLESLRACVRNGPAFYPGANLITTPSRMQLEIPSHDRAARNQLAAQVRVGWTVSRHLVKGDWIVMNRQPTLHKLSMMGHRVARVFEKGHTFRLSLQVTPPYNADMDGDEMNAHIPQGLMARAEVATFMSVPHLIVNQQSHRATVALVQDGLVGCMFMSRKSCFYTKAQVCDLIMQMDYDAHGKQTRICLPPPAILKPQPLWTGKQVISCCIPAGVNFDKSVRGGSGMDPMESDERTIIVRHGELLAGSLCKQTVGVASDSLIETVWRDCGPDACNHFISDLQRVAMRGILGKGFSVGFDDITAPPAIKKQVQQCFAAAESANKRKYEQLLESTRRNSVSGNHGSADGETLKRRKRMKKEALAFADTIANGMLGRIGAITQQGLSVDKNALHAMVTCGSKGNPWNNAAMRGGLCQQYVAGKRIGFVRDVSRTLPCFAHNPRVPSLAEHGFVTHAYHEGLLPEEMIMHSMGGREGLVDTAVKTSDVGYTHRKIMKFTESLRVRADGFVVDGRGKVGQFAYGGDGMDGSRVQNVLCPAVHWSNDECKDALQWDGTSLWQEELTKLLKARDRVRRMRRNVFSTNPVLAAFSSSVAVLPSSNAKVVIPANPLRVTKRIMQIESDAQKYSPAARPEDVAERVDALVKDIEADTGKLAGMQLRGCAGQVLAIRNFLTTKYLCGQLKVSGEQLESICDTVLRMYLKGRAESGEMTGTVAAQSVGEPATQMTLNTFHAAGTTAVNVTLGVPRLKEIIDATRKMKKPSATVFLKPPFNVSAESANVAARALEFVPLSNAVTRAVIVPYVSHNGSDLVTLSPTKDCQSSPECWATMQVVPEDGSVLSKHVMRFELDSEFLLTKSLSAQDVAQALWDYALSRIQISWSERVVHARLLVDSEMLERVPPEADVDKIERLMARNVQQVLLSRVALCGIEGITAAKPTRMGTQKYHPDTGAPRIAYEWAVLTEGVSLKELLGHPWVDATRTYCNDPHETLLVQGIEAAQYVNYNELRNVMSYDNVYVNSRHFTLPCDMMTSKGFLMAMNRHGIKSAEFGFLVRSSFEETVEVLFDAAAYGERDVIADGVTERIIVGQVPAIGTELIDVFAPLEDQ